MDSLLNLIGGVPFVGEFLKTFLGPILGGIGVALAALFAYLKGKKDQEQKGKIAVQKETIQAHEDRDDVEDAIAGMSDDERKRLRTKWTTRDN